MESWETYSHLGSAWDGMSILLKLPARELIAPIAAHKQGVMTINSCYFVMVQVMNYSQMSLSHEDFIQLPKVSYTFSCVAIVWAITLLLLLMLLGNGGKWLNAMEHAGDGV